MTRREHLLAELAALDPSIFPTVAQIEQEIARRAIERGRKLQSRRGWYDKDGVRQGGLMEFIRYFWRVLEPGTDLVEGWVLWAIVEHLEAVTFGEITRLLINVYPGAMKSLLTDVYWPAWEQGPMDMPHLRYVAFSYSDDLTVRDNNRYRDLILSWEYQQMWGERFALTKVGERKVENDRTGWKFASSIGGVGTGERGNRVILDDAHNVKTAESKKIREDTVKWFRESMQNRLNDQTTDVIIAIMQRTHEEDVSGCILDRQMPYVHLCIPMEYDPTRHCETAIGWSDPRTEEGELADPERFPADTVAQLKKDIGPYAYAAQYQQEPAPRSGVIFQRDWWQVWEPDTEEAKKIADHDAHQWPPLEFVLGILDGAYTEKEENDPSGMVVLGLFRDRIGRPKIALRHAWRKRLGIHGPMIERRPDESEIAYLRRAQPHWGLVEWTEHTCQRFRVETLLIEAKASGISTAQSIQSMYRDSPFSVVLEPVVGDKVARAMSVVPIFSNEMMYAPAAAKEEQPADMVVFRAWAQMVIDEMCAIAGTMIITRAGLVPIEQVQVGDLVLTHRGRFRPVLATFVRRTDKLITLEPKSLDPLTLTPNHPFYALDLTCERSLRNGGAEWVTAADMKAREYRPAVRNGKRFEEAVPSASHAATLPIVRPECPINEIDLREWVTLPNGKKYSILEDDEWVTTSHGRSQAMRWHQSLDHQFGRVIGLYLAEGSTRRAQTSWSFNAKERPLIEEVKKFITDRLGCRASERTQGRGTTVYASLPLLETFFAECGRGAHMKRVPEWVWDAPDDFVCGLIEGYMDGDGHRVGNILVATTVSPSLAWGVRLLCLRLGIFATVRLGRAPTVVTINNRTSQTRQVYIVEWRIDRKNDGAAVPAGDVVGYSVMRKSEIAKSCDVFNLEVAEDNSYCTTGGALHNSMFPKGRYDDLTDCVVHGLRYLRRCGYAKMPSEIEQEQHYARQFRPRKPALYPGMRARVGAR